MRKADAAVWILVALAAVWVAFLWIDTVTSL